MITSISLGIEGIPNEDTFNRMVKDLQVVVILNKDEGMTANFTKVRQVRHKAEPTFI